MSKIDRIRGSINVPLDKAGRDEAERVGKLFAAGPGVDLLICSDLLRARQTAEIIKKFNPSARGPISTDALHPWHLGEWEGQPTSEVISKIQALTKTPNEKAPGRSPQGTQPGESFNSFTKRVLDFEEDLIEYYRKHPSLIIVEVTHLRVVKLLEAWLREGASSDHNIDVDSMNEDRGEDPGAVFKIGHKRLAEVSSPSGGGVYPVRHGSTALNGDKASS